MRSEGNQEASATPSKAESFIDRFREIVSDPLNLLIERVPMAGVVKDGYVVLHNGLRVPINCYYGDFSSILVVNRVVHEPLEEYVFQEVLGQLDPTEPLKMIELGSYWAHYSMWLKKKFPNAQTLCVEPVDQHLEAGRKNFELNGMEGEFIQSFVSKEHFQVDGFLADGSLGEIDILHADIQGFEVEMLMGCANTLARRDVKRIFVSTHSQALHEDVVRILTDAGYRIDVSSDFDTETTSFDGLVYASLPSLPPLFSGIRIMGRTAICKTAAPEIVAYVGRILDAGQAR